MNVLRHRKLSERQEEEERQGLEKIKEKEKKIFFIAHI